MGAAYGWFAGWVAICAYAAANTTIAYLGAPWALAVLGIEPKANTLVVTATVFVIVCAVASMGGVVVLKRVLGAGVAAEAIALAALAVGGWVFIGFDACVGSSEETRGASRQVPARSGWSC
jgi:amino acid transporter